MHLEGLAHHLRTGLKGDKVHICHLIQSIQRVMNIAILEEVLLGHGLKVRNGELEGALVSTSCWWIYIESEHIGDRVGSIL